VYRYTFQDGLILMANQGLVEILDLDCRPQDLVGHPLREFLIYTEPEGTVRAALEEHGEIHGFEYHFQTLKGEDRWVLHDSFIATDEASGQRVVEAIVRDITGRKLAEAALRHEHDFIEAVLEVAGALVVVLDRQGRIERFNRACERTTGYTFAEVHGRPLWDMFLLPEERQSVMSVFLQLRAGDFPLNHENYWLTKDGRRRLIAWSNNCLINEQGEVEHVIATGLDITEARLAEEALQRAHGELEQRVQERTAELAQANQALRAEIGTRERAERRIVLQAEDLARSNEELEQFAYVASHDLQEPLRKIRAFGDRLEACCGAVLSGEGRDYLNRMENAAGRMQTLIDDLLTYSRVTTQGRPFVPVDLGQIVTEVLSDLEVRIEQTGATIQVGELGTIEADPAQMRRLLQNLIGNALKFRRAEAPLEVWITGELVEDKTPGGGRYYRLEVRDNGIGFDDKYAERIFAVFQRLHTREEYEGTGMGLAICRKIVDRHGGTIAARGRPGEGASFVVALPVRQ
jgi:PAS domain S-box-containing protein